MDAKLIVSSVAETAPTFTIAIPHYKHRRHLEVVISSLAAQTSADFDVLISDDASADDSREVIPQVLEDSHLRYRYFLQAENVGYDENLRFCLDNAVGEYVLVLGNDDALVSPQTMDELGREVGSAPCSVAFTNYVDFSNPGSVTTRAIATQVLGSGPHTAIRFFRSFSFVGGLLFKSDEAKSHSTSRWNGSIYYQIYLACRMVAAGGSLASLNVVAVRKDVRVGDQTTPNYASRAMIAPRSFEPRHIGLDSVIRVTADAVDPFLEPTDRSSAKRRIMLQMFSITYPFWLFEYRRVGRWSHSVGLARRAAPMSLARELRLRFGDRFLVVLAYALMTAAGLLLPRTLFSKVETRMAGAIRKTLQSRPAETS